MKIKKISGILIFLSFLVTIYSYFIALEVFVYSGILAWASLFFLFFKILNKKLLIALLFLSFCFFIYSLSKDFFIDYERAILVNQYLLTLLIGVGFLRLIATPKKEKVKKNFLFPPI